jgi:ribosomal protein L32
MQEYQRQCMTCGKVWHSLVAREQEISRNQKSNNCNVVAQGCGCNPAAQLQAKRNTESNQSELSNLRKCPQCGSAKFNERIINHTKQTQQIQR